MLEISPLVCQVVRVRILPYDIHTGVSSKNVRYTVIIVLSYSIYCSPDPDSEENTLSHFFFFTLKNYDFFFFFFTVSWCFYNDLDVSVHPSPDASVVRSTVRGFRSVGHLSRRVIEQLRTGARIWRVRRPTAPVSVAEPRLNGFERIATKARFGSVGRSVISPIKTNLVHSRTGAHLLEFGSQGYQVNCLNAKYFVAAVSYIFYESFSNLYACKGLNDYTS